MTAGLHDEPKVIQNLEADCCLSSTAEAQFFADLATAAPPTTCCDAHFTAVSAAAGRPGLYLCRGKPVETGRFEVAVRLRKPKDFMHCIPIPVRNQFMSRFGLTPAILEMAGADDLATWLEAYAHDLLTGGKVPVAWVTEGAAVPSDITLGELVDRLGLDDSWNDTKVGIIFRYGRPMVPSDIRLPLALDGLPFTRFAFAGSCTAPFGVTAPRSLPDGLPEGVHAACAVPAGQFSFDILV